MLQLCFSSILFSFLCSHSSSVSGAWLSPKASDKHRPSKLERSAGTLAIGIVRPGADPVVSFNSSSPIPKPETPNVHGESPAIFSARYSRNLHRIMGLSNNNNDKFGHKWQLKLGLIKRLP